VKILVIKYYEEYIIKFFIHKIINDEQIVLFSFVTVMIIKEKCFTTKYFKMRNINRFIKKKIIIIH